MGPPETVNGKTTQIIHADSNASYNRGRLYHLIRAGSKQRAAWGQGTRSIFYLVSGFYLTLKWSALDWRNEIT